MTTVPDEGVCSVCEDTVRLRRGGTCWVHPRAYDPDGLIVFTIVDGQAEPVSADCPGSRQHPAVRLEMTFSRWLRAHHTRRDARSNPVTFLAQWVFKACSRTPAKTVAEVDWATPEELHLKLTARPGECDWIGEYIDRAAAEFEAYSAARAG